MTRKEFLKKVDAFKDNQMLTFLLGVLAAVFLFTAALVHLNASDNRTAEMVVLIGALWVMGLAFAFFFILFIFIFIICADDHRLVDDAIRHYVQTLPEEDKKDNK